MYLYAGPAAVILSIVLSGCAAPRSAALAPRAPAGATTAGTIEASDPSLAAALLAARVIPNAQSHVRVAQEYRRLRILDAAYRNLELALARDPHLAEAHEEMARVWREWGFPERALAYASRAVYYAPDSGGAHNTLGTVLDELKRFDDARREYSAALTLDPSAAWAQNNLCSLEFRLGRFAAAVEQCRAAVREDPALVAAHNNLALSLAASGEMAGAREAFLAAGDLAAAHYNIGIVHLSSGRYLDAALEFEEAIRQRPSFTAAKTRAHDARMRLLTSR